MSLPSPSDTILAVSSAPGRSSLACLRLSGPGALRVAASVLSDPCALLEGKGFRGFGAHLELERARVPAWVQIYRAPRSYTREDLVELYVPGSPPVVSMVCSRILKCDAADRSGVRWAKAGEFTLRAFLNGRIDLSQAEAVAALISAEGEAEASAARRGLRGEQSARWKELARGVVEVLGLVEASLDFPDEDLPAIEPELVAQRIQDLADRLDRELSSSALRVPAAGSLRVAIAGLPNAGKSSLLNAIVGKTAAITSPLPGTTRDPVRGTSEFQGMRIEWVDLAGIWKAKDLELPSASSSPPGSAVGEEVGSSEWKILSEIVVRLTHEELECADVAIWVADPTSELEASLEAFRALEAPVKLLVFQKADLLTEAQIARFSSLPERPSIVSARTGMGVQDLVGRVVAEASGSRRPAVTSRYLVSAYQQAALRIAREHLGRAIETLGSGLGLEYAAVDLREALAALEGILGARPRDEVLELIFSRFCIGK